MTPASNTKLPAIERFESNIGVRIYRMPVEAFPGFIAYTYLLLDGSAPILVDTGSNLETSQKDLLDGIAAVRDDFGEHIEVEDINQILITHAHIDHHGGLNFMYDRTRARIGVHALDRRILMAYEERIVMTVRNVRLFLQSAGVSEKTINGLLEIYGFAKRLIKSQRVDFLLEEGYPLEYMEFIHTPGHCPGQVCIRVGDIMLTADHILGRITPHQAPESITHFTGLGHYLESLDKVAEIQGIDLALGGHEKPIRNMYARIDAIRIDHQKKLDNILSIIRKAKEPLNISEISKQLYPDVQSYNILLALEETGAHVEYLYERGHIGIENLDAVEHEAAPILRYGIV
jgi:glyoxylase-like metal-dependent hydrolase (beta-lactamase superfamily II)